MKKSFLLLLLTGNALLLQAQQLQPWKLQLQPGHSYTITNTLQTNLTQNMMGQELKMANIATTTAILKVLAADAKGYQLAQTSNRLQLNMNMNTPMGQQDVQFDSDKKEDREGELGQQIGSLIGATTEALLAPNGQLTITKAPQTDETLNLPGLGVAANDSVAIKGYFLPPPATALKAGDTWKESYNSETTQSNITYRYLRTEAGVAYFEYEQAVTVNQTVTTNGMEVQSSQTVTGTGTLQVELGTGLVLQRTFDGKINGKSEVMGMEIPQEGTQKVTVRLVKN